MKLDTNRILSLLPDGRGRIGERLSVDAIAQAFKRVAKWIKMSAKEVAQVSGHSIRVGATPDLLALNIDLASVMQGTGPRQGMSRHLMRDALLP
jgi:hypothetical protein